MKAIVAHEFGPPDVLKLEEVADPQPGPGQIVVRVHAAGVNPVDTYIRAGKYGKVPFPHTPGKDAAGVVAALGGGVTGFKVGDRVYTSEALSGSYAEKVLCAASMVHRLPDNASFAAGASLGIAAGVAYFALFYRAEARPGETVLVHGGTGGVGLAAIQFARAAGMTVFATASEDSGRKLVLQQGAHQAFDHHITDDPERLKALTGGKGVDVILEMAAHVNLAQDLTVLSDRGRVAVIGSRGPIEIDPRQTMQRNCDIRGVTLMKMTPAEDRGVYAAVTAGVEAGTLRPVIALEMPLQEAARAHEEVMSQHAPGKIILRPDGSSQ